MQKESFTNKNKIRERYIFITKDNFYVHLNLEVVKEILNKDDFSSFIEFDKASQLAYLKDKSFTIEDIIKRTKKNFHYIKK